MEEGLSQENYLRLALRLRCGFCQITLTSCSYFNLPVRSEIKRTSLCDAIRSLPFPYLSLSASCSCANLRYLNKSECPISWLSLMISQRHGVTNSNLSCKATAAALQQKHHYYSERCCYLTAHSRPSDQLFITTVASAATAAPILLLLICRIGKSYRSTCPRVH